MSYSNGPSIVTNGLVLALDASDRNSYVSGSTTWIDLVGSNNGSLINGPTFNTGSGGSIVFDGVNDYTSIAYTPILTPTSSISFGGWAYRPIWINTTNSRLLSKTQEGGYQLSFSEGSFIPPGKFGTLIHLGGTYYTVTQSLSIISQDWNHFFSTCDGRYIKLYLNGNLINTYDKGSTSPITYNNNNLFLVGAEPGSDTGVDGFYFNGRISNILVYNRALSDVEVLQNYNAQKSRYIINSINLSGSLATNGLIVNLEAWNTSSYSGTGTTWFDISGNNYNATLQGTTSYSGSYIDLGSGQDTTNYLTLSTSSLANLTSWTIDLWLYRHTANSIDTFLTLGQDGSGNRFLWYFRPNTSTVDFENTAYSNTLYSVTNGEPFLFTAVGASNNISIYKNGSFVGTISNTTTITAVSTIGLVLGQEMDSTSGGFDATQKFRGKYGAIRFYNRALSDNEVANNYLYTLNKYI